MKMMITKILIMTRGWALSKDAWKNNEMLTNRGKLETVILAFCCSRRVLNVYIMNLRQMSVMEMIQKEALLVSLY